jgi:hypothetical protein
MSTASKSLKNQVDGGFAQGGWQVVKAREYKHDTPSWVNNDKKVQKILLQSFPKLRTNTHQREAAGRWGRIIQLYFRTGYTHTQVAHEMGLTPDQVRSTIRAIRRAASGLRADGSGPRSGRIGRPRTNAPQS